MILFVIFVISLNQNPKSIQEGASSTHYAVLNPLCAVGALDAHYAVLQPLCAVGV
jgi:hypothetical protein